MYNLPLLLDLLKVLNLRPPGDKTAFEEARLQFTIHGQRVEFNRVNLYGYPVSLSGQGSMNIDGTDMNLDFFPLWRIMQYPAPPLDKIPPLISQQVLKIKMRGSLRK